MMWIPRQIPICGPVTPTPEPDPPATTPAPDERDETGLGAARRTALALALHERWHHTPCEKGDTVCAETSGAFDDAAAIEPLILAWLTTALGTGIGGAA